MSSRMSSGSELRLRTAPRSVFQPFCEQEAQGQLGSSRTRQGGRGTHGNLGRVEEGLVERGEAARAPALADGVADDRGALCRGLVRDARHAACGRWTASASSREKWPSGGERARRLATRQGAAALRSSRYSVTAPEAAERASQPLAAVLVEVASSRGGGCRARPLARSGGAREGYRDVERRRTDLKSSLVPTETVQERAEVAARRTTTTKALGRGSLLVLLTLARAPSLHRESL